MPTAPRTVPRAEHMLSEHLHLAASVGFGFCGFSRHLSFLWELLLSYVLLWGPKAAKDTLRSGQVSLNTPGWAAPIKVFSGRL